jgi:transposase
MPGVGRQWSRIRFEFSAAYSPDRSLVRSAFSYLSPDARVRADHPLRAIRRITDAALTEISPQLEAMYSDLGRPSIPPEQLLRALVIQVLYSVRSERLLMEEIDYSLLFRWFIGVNLDTPIWSPTTFSKNRERLLRGDIAGAFFAAIADQARAAGLLSDEHFTVNGTLLEAWASLFSPRDDIIEVMPGEGCSSKQVAIAARKSSSGEALQRTVNDHLASGLSSMNSPTATMACQRGSNLSFRRSFAWKN